MRACFALIVNELLHIDDFVVRQNFVEKNCYKVNLFHKLVFNDSNSEKNANH